MFTLRPSLPVPRRIARLASLGLAFGLAASPVIEAVCTTAVLCVYTNIFRIVFTYD